MESRPRILTTSFFGAARRHKVGAVAAKKRYPVIGKGEGGVRRTGGVELGGRGVYQSLLDVGEERIIILSVEDGALVYYKRQRTDAGGAAQ